MADVEKLNEKKENYGKKLIVGWNSLIKKVDEDVDEDTTPSDDDFDPIYLVELI